MIVHISFSFIILSLVYIKNEQRNNCVVKLKQKWKQALHTFNF